MSEIRIENITKSYDKQHHIFNDFSVTFQPKEFIAILGPSGCGKSTLLRMISGLETFESGKIFIDGEDVSKKDPKDRDIAMVFQNYALYPHKTVYQNLEFGLKMRGVAKKEREENINAAVDMLDIRELLKRRPRELSGGQRQRVALGRALVRNPKLFLLDEPLSNLDAKLRVKMRSEIIQLYQRIDKTMIYVTHDQTEAMTMGTKILLLNHGQIQQYDDPDVLYDRPANLFVAQFIGSPQMNIYRLPIDNGQIHFADQYFTVPESVTDSEVYIGIRAEDASMIEGESFTVSHTENLGNERLVYVIQDEQEFCVRDYSKQLIEPGSRLNISMDESKLHWFDINTEQRIEQ